MNRDGRKMCIRDSSKTDPDWVRAFLEKYGPQMSKLSVREAGKYV